MNTKENANTGPQHARKPVQGQMVLPIMEALSERGGVARTKDIYEDVAQKLAVDPQHRAERIRPCASSSHTVNRFEREVRWAQQKAKLMGLIAPETEQSWSITGKGKKALSEALPGKVITIFTTANGCALFASCEDAMGYIEDASISLIFTSPPYPLLTKKDYGNVSEDEYVEWLLRLMQQWPKKLTADGSIVINTADVFMPGSPTLSLYQEKMLLRLQQELGLNLCQRLTWQNPSKMPAPAEWVTVRRIRLKPSTENIFWLSPSKQPYADNRNVLQPYSQAMTKRIAQGGEKGATRPSGHCLAPGTFGRDNGGAIHPTLITAANTSSNSQYHRLCREYDIERHPATFPEALPEFFIKFLTQPGDIVGDFFAGSGTTGYVAERLGRRWISAEKVLQYIHGAQLRFCTV